MCSIQSIINDGCSSSDGSKMAYSACLRCGMEGFQRGGDQDNSYVQVQRACTLRLSQSTEKNKHATL